MFKPPLRHKLTFPDDHPLAKRFNGDDVGMFQFQTKEGTVLNVIAENNDGWEHVSITIKNGDRCPTWDEMCFVKDMFWSDDDNVIQIHPKKKDYVNIHEYCLHLWRNKKLEYLLYDL